MELTTWKLNQVLHFAAICTLTNVLLLDEPKSSLHVPVVGLSFTKQGGPQDSGGGLQTGPTLGRSVVTHSTRCIIVEPSNFTSTELVTGYDLPDETTINKDLLEKYFKLHELPTIAANTGLVLQETNDRFWGTLGEMRKAAADVWAGIPAKISGPLKQVFLRPQIGTVISCCLLFYVCHNVHVPILAVLHRAFAHIHTKSRQHRSSGDALKAELHNR